jgi:RimJ/RimL family protein N-acetyltransferase
MTFEKLEEIIDENDIPHNVILMSDSGWEVDATHMDGVFYNKDENTIVFTQSGDELESYADESWKWLWSDLFEKNINGSVLCSDEIRLVPLGLYSKLEDSFKEELRKTGEFESFYGLTESEYLYSQIQLVRPLFFKIWLNGKTGPKAIGYLGLNIKYDVCEAEIYVFKDYREKGYGKLALRTLIDELIQKELKVFNREKREKEVYMPRKIIASVRIENEAANALMLACGFKRKDDAAVAFHAAVNPEEEMEKMVQVIPYEIDLESIWESICDPIVMKIQSWIDYAKNEPTCPYRGNEELHDKYRAENDLDCVLTDGNLCADTIFSLWMPLRQVLTSINDKAYIEEYLGMPLSKNIPFLEALVKPENLEHLLPKNDKRVIRLSRLFELGQTRANVMLLPFRQMNSARGRAPYYDYMPYFLVECFENGAFSKYFDHDEEKLGTWIEQEKLTPFFQDSVQKEHIKDLALTGDVRKSRPVENISMMLENYIDILKQRGLALSAHTKI